MFRRNQFDAQRLRINKYVYTYSGLLDISLDFFSRTGWPNECRTTGEENNENPMETAKYAQYRVRKTFQ